MKITTPILTTVFSILMAMPSAVAAVSYFDHDGWPNWIDRIDGNREEEYSVEMQAKYIPLSLIKTGGFEKMVKEVEMIPNLNTAQWPSWIGELRNQQ